MTTRKKCLLRRAQSLIYHNQSSKLWNRHVTVTINRQHNGFKEQL